MDLTRRKFLVRAGLTIAAAPLIVRASSLMKVRVIPAEILRPAQPERVMWTVQSWSGEYGKDRFTVDLVRSQHRGYEDIGGRGLLSEFRSMWEDERITIEVDAAQMADLVPPLVTVDVIEVSGIHDKEPVVTLEYAQHNGGKVSLKTSVKEFEFGRRPEFPGNDYLRPRMYRNDAYHEVTEAQGLAVIRTGTLHRKVSLNG